MTPKKYGYFSAAIREGAVMTPKGTPYLLLDREGGTCALGAGAMALGLPTQKCGDWRILPDTQTNRAIKKMFPYMGETLVECPACGTDHDLLNVVADLFDVELWSREKIAAWLYEREEELGWITLDVDAEALKPEVALDLAPMKATAQFPSHTLILK